MVDQTTSETAEREALDLEDVDVVLEHLDDVTRAPALRRAGQVTTRLTWVLVALVLAAGTFALGAKLGHDHGTSTSSSGVPTNLAAALANRRRGAASSGTGSSAAGGGAGRSADGGRTFGTVKLVDGSNLYIETQTGVVKVTTTPGVRVDVTAAGSLSDLQPGDTVTVEGTPGADSTTMQATSISQATGGFGQGGGFGRAGGGLGQASGSGG